MSKLNISLNKEKLKELSKKLGHSSLVLTIRQALELLKTISDNKKYGTKVIIENPGEEKIELVLW